MPVRLAIPLDVERPEQVRPMHVHAVVCEALERELAHTMRDALASIAGDSGTGAGTPQGMGVTRYLGGRPLGAARRERAWPTSR